ncbi:protein MpPP2C_KAPP [Marchantia polymorpha subsp. ruderalis]|uniref:protein-serine/threonine phosphatase n=2 Tax=Marchantia polymorpha TaxID=3197 RepID=A0AAF6BXU3_MARPO|nr:hypothetical protein MARPO_0156s0019 [Marchantia polymorpha]BBN16827.1 hypothetical protein Mp_7g09640 [Marchantia polymorpha subsp. ruderalis]|eukprot:PTQ28721.1 hypothetical protein MARPO_0156s0019 [Marchantia polymorpha]
MVVVEKVLVVGGIMLVGYGVYAFTCRLRRRWHCVGGPEEKREELTEPLVTTEENQSTIKRQSTANSSAKRLKPSPSQASPQGIDKRPKDEEWIEPVTTTASGHGDMESNGLLPPADATAQSTNLQLEVISGPSAGVHISQQSKKGSGLTLTVGRILQNDLVLNDPEVSGKHALISWNSKISKWELVDMGSLNGTLVNYRSVAATHAPNAPIRQRGNPVGLVNGDIVTLGSTSQVLVRILSGKKSAHFAIASTPFGVGLAADPMTTRRGGKQLPMEDVNLAEWPLRGFQEFGVFCIFDGHGGAAAAEAASRLMPQKLSDILSDEEKRSRVINECDATEVLQEAFRETEEEIDGEYEGCTATVLLLWAEGRDYYAQCANVGDSACVFCIGDKHIPVTEDHRLTSFSERCRLLEMGKQLREGETRLCGMNIARALGDKFLKEQDDSFSSQPYVSEVLKLEPESRALAVMASDGLWDVMSSRRALNFAVEARDGKCATAEGRKVPPQSAEGIADMLVSKARALRTKDNTSVIVLDFGCNSKLNFRTL